MDRGWPGAGTTVVAVIGDPVAHSLSPLLYNTAFGATGLDWICVGFTVPPGGAPGALQAVRALGLAGLSVTMPHKRIVAALVDDCTPIAGRLGSVNCVVQRAGGRLVGDSTDGAGFLASLVRSAGFDPAGRSCVVAGTGGAARAVVAALADAGASEVVVVGRRPEEAAGVAALAGAAGRVGGAGQAAGADLVVDATPVGMPGVQGPPLVDPAGLGPGQVAADLVYHPIETPWLAAAARRGAVPVGGLGMLVHQAAEQFTCWTGREAPVEQMWSAATDALTARHGVP